MNEQQYCIAKTSRYNDGDIVTRIPYDPPPNPDWYDDLRSTIYNTYQEAREAANKAEKRNPLGMVVVTLQRKDE